jgi:hypothetical protein
MPEKVEKGEKTIGALLSELTLELRTLLRQELELFIAELKEKVTNIAVDAVGIGVGLFMVYLGSLVLLAAIVIALTTVMPAWGAALLVAAAFLGTGGALVLVGFLKLARLEKKPEKTLETLKETVTWAKTLRLRSSTQRRTRFASKSGLRKAI